MQILVMTWSFISSSFASGYVGIFFKDFLHFAYDWKDCKRGHGIYVYGTLQNEEITKWLNISITRVKFSFSTKGLFDKYDHRWDLSRIDVGENTLS